MKRLLLWGLAAATVLLGGAAQADSEVKGWVTRVDPAGQTVEVNGQTLPLARLRVTGGALEPGVFVEIERGRIKVKPQRPPADDQIIRVLGEGARNPGRSEFSHLRHFNALGTSNARPVTPPKWAS
jgi:hypothetical protein